MSGSQFHHFHPEDPAPSPSAAGLKSFPTAPARVKLASTVLLIAGTMMLPASEARWLSLVAAILLLAGIASRISPWRIIRRLTLLAPFLACTMLASVLQPGAALDWRIVLAKSALCLTAVILLSATTPFGAILRVMQGMRIPGLLITTMALMHRYLFVLADETVRMRRARTSRTFIRRRRFTWTVLSTVAARLFVRASERAERVYDAMCARGWK